MNLISSALNLDGRVAIVTGASRGLGKAMALALGRAGADIMVTARTAHALEETCQEVRSLGRRCHHVPADVSCYSDVERMVQAALDLFGRIDILVNNSGIAIEKPLLDTSEEEWRRVIDVNLNGMFFCAKLVGRHMVERGKGKIINVSSVFGYKGAPNLVSYCVSKGGIIQLTRALAVEWAKYHINVNAIAPGYFATNLNEKLLGDERTREALLRRIPLRRVAKPEELDYLVVYLASDASDFITGEVITIDGGQSAI